MKLAKRLNVPIYRIGRYRAKFPTTLIGEVDAWVALFRDLSKRKWRNCILETTGLNCRESFLKYTLPRFQMITIKLTGKKKVLYERIKNKRFTAVQRWLFSDSYPSKAEFVKKMYKEFQRLPTEIKIETSQRKPEEVYRIALSELKGYMQAIHHFHNSKLWNS